MMASKNTTNQQQENSYALTEQNDAALPVKKKRQRPDKRANPEPGDNTKYLTHSMKLADLPDISAQNVDQVKDRIRTYFQFCAEDDVFPSISGLALATGIDRRRLWEIREGTRGDYPSEVRDALKKAQKIIELQLVDCMQSGKINPVTGIWFTKTHHGYQEEQVVVVRPDSPIGDPRTQQALLDEYLEKVDDT